MIKNWKGIGSISTIGLEIVVAIVVGLMGGRWIDGKLQTAPLFAVLGFLLGLATAAKAVHRGWREMQRVAEREEREEGNPAPLFDEPSTDNDAAQRSARSSPIPKDPSTPPESTDEQR